MPDKCISLQQRINAFATLGKYMRDGADGSSEGFAGHFSHLIENLEPVNPWFTPENVRFAVRSAGERLTTENLSLWLSRYPGISESKKTLTVGTVMAGNIPLVGFHDLLCVLITGNKIIAKLSSKDALLMKTVTEALAVCEPAFADYIEVTEDKLSGFDMVIATGSDNTSRYFDYYFRGYPSLIRHNRNSIALIDGTESGYELKFLGFDIFAYFGLGCRNISKLYLPAGYDIKNLTAQWNEYEKLRGHHKYAVNYDHNKAVMIINRQSFIDTGFVLLRHDKSLTPPMAVLNYEFYPSKEWLENEIEVKRNLIQCVTGHTHTPFGKAQCPELWDYADDVDTILFLLKKNYDR